METDRVYHLYLPLPTTPTNTLRLANKHSCAVYHLIQLKLWRQRDQSPWDSILNGHKTNELRFSHWHLNESNEAACHDVLLPATSYQPFSSLFLVSCMFVSIVSLFYCFSPTITLCQSNQMIGNVTFALAKHFICLTLPPAPWYLLYFHHIVPHLSVLAEEMQCAQSGLQISGEAFRTWV